MSATEVPESGSGSDFPAIIKVTWSGASTTNAASEGFAPNQYGNGVYGANADGATTANVYYVCTISGTKTWVDTGATVANFHGG